MGILRKSALVFCVLLFCSCKDGNVTEKKDEQKVIQKVITFNLASRGKTFKNIFSDVNVWYYGTYWDEQASNQSAQYFSNYHPFVKRIQFMTATGGNESRDLFIDPSDKSVLNDYKFDAIITALKNVVKQGLVPMIKTGSVPLKYSANPKICGFGVNVSPPDDFDVYYDYIKALANKLVDKFGIEEVKNWSWGVLTEFENLDWWSVDDNPDLSKEAYFMLYDYTVAALQDAIGADNLIVGAHAMVCHPGLWDELDFIDHVTKGSNNKTGEIGTQIDFIAASFYDETPGVPVDVNLSLHNTIKSLRDKAVSNGLNNLKYGIDEGRILNGEDDLPLFSRVIAHSFQAAADARLFKIMNELDADWFSTWTLSTQGIWDGIPSVGTHIAWLSYKMVGEQELNQTIDYMLNNNSNEVDGLASYNSEKNKLHVMIYNYNRSLKAKTKESCVIKIRNIQPIDGAEVLVKKWIVDDSHGNYWPSWFSDMVSNGVSSEDFTGWSTYSVEASLSLKGKAMDLWYVNKDKYRDLATLVSTPSTCKIENDILELSTKLDHHGVVFYEIENIRPV